MTWPQEYSFIRYLSSKKTVDDRALNQHVFQSLKAAIQLDGPRKTLDILEIGVGIGTMIERMRDWGLFDSRTAITAIDVDADNILAARERLAGSSIPIVFEAVDVFEFIQREQGIRQWDALIANAFLDLVDTRKLLSLLRSLIKPSGVAYLSINFDGVTILEPAIEPALDAHIERLYHQTMDERMVGGQPSGDSQTGRHLFQCLNEAGYHVLAAGSSDWVVSPLNAGYPNDEAYFLHFIIHTMQHALIESPELDSTALADWAARRHQQIENGQLVYIAHQLDFLAQPSR